MKFVYADNNATTMVAPEVVETMLPYFTEYYGNPSSMHTFGGQVAKKIDSARQQVAELIGADPGEVIFTSCGTESDNAAILGILKANPHKRHIVTSRVEHSAVYNLCKYLAQNGYHVTELGVDTHGMLNLNELADAIKEDTAVVSIMYANNETGVIFPIEEIGNIVKQKGSLLHTDAVQAVGKIPINLSKSTIDLLTLSGHKLHAPKGVGALFIRKGITFAPFIIGGHQEKNRRGGTENVPSIIGLGKACELAKKHLVEEQNGVKLLRDKLENEILEKAPDARLNGHKIHRLPNTTNLSFEFVEGEAILLLLNEKGICASSGSACTSGSLEPSHVLRAMGVPFTAVHGSVRLSLSRYSTMEDVDFIIEHLPPIIRRLREISPYGRDTKVKGQVVTTQVSARP
ncbi:MAG: cysteine desulfurase NifS [Candidatus Jettenia sp.]|uniref:Cysteine desulfurase n=1 Tax=Candidatus Jettenia caeni TaxID=247490 RepID=I3IIE2_9BACT|nr:cysteine desulfurase NifS [Candidatus Jettenia sp. AMX1]MBC6928276.1 cysteine desulfurase NifS [Candidatus Jettenia sp.]NUN23065.1 cysteine desulfurase NifS [Candidatus Jettenia caeni]KAA0249963.1 MAG: cysteine desulfurase NifS [Candidatus Jettenia sp. AMX1]MCE7880442.1 cysteine desulfurase NifS [Candidatus Jettenia sp. AMX1]MCQ3926250.1 cysteine desulfurase NifS [Candidatus Jettenia sp.]